MKEIKVMEKETISSSDISGKEIECECGCGSVLRVFRTKESYELVIHTVFVNPENQWKHTVMVTNENMKRLLE